jgi:hypothetical protein
VCHPEDRYTLPVIKGHDGRSSRVVCNLVPGHVPV